MSAHRGFTLIEVLVALAIVAFGMAAVLAAMTSAADNAFFMRDKTLAEWIALNQISLVRLKDAMPAKGKTQGEVDDFAGRKWFWQQEVQELQLKGMLRIDVSVRPLKEGESKDSAGSKQAGWYATASGVMGDAVERSWPITSVWIPPPGSGDPNGGGGKTDTTATPKENSQ